jgi:Flp pilus assembly protein TadG
MNRHFQRLLSRFGRDDRGNVAMIFGLALVPVIGLAGASVDYGRASQLRTKMGAAADAAVLAAVKATGKTLAERTVIANAAFAANLGYDSSLTGAAGTLTAVNDWTYRYQVSAEYQYSVIKALPGAGTSAPLSVYAQATDGGLSKLEIVLAMDNTGSMGWSNKMVELKRALCGDPNCANDNPTTGFVKIMKDAARDPEQIRVALVPFDTTVRVPLDVQNAVVGGSDIAATFSYNGAGYCNPNPTTASRVSLSPSNASQPTWLRFAARDKDTISSNRNSSNVNVGTGCGVGRVTRTTWQGCLWDRDQVDDLDTKPSGVDSGDIRTLYPAVTCRSNALARMMSLVDIRTNTTQLVTALRSMQPSGNTNVTIGATWGVSMLTPGLPLSTAIPPEPNLTRYLILLTDGDNTENKTNGGSGQINNRTALACANAKAQGIVVYSVRVIEGNRNLLRNCASSPSNYYEVANAAQLTDVFENIANRIGSIRLTQ